MSAPQQASQIYNLDAYVTPGIEVNAFSVLDAVVSDHAPLYLEFSVSVAAILADEEMSVSNVI